MDNLFDFDRKTNDTEGDRINVRIYNQNFILSTGDKDPQYVERVAQYVDSLMREISETSRIVDTRRVAILAALYIADELLRLKENKNELKEGFSGQIKDMVDLLEQALK